MNAAIEEAIRSNNSEDEDEANRRRLSYANVKEFKAVNPGCCAVTARTRTEGLKQQTFIQRALGLVHFIVRVAYQQLYAGSAGDVVSKPVVRIYEVSNCGVVY